MRPPPTRTATQAGKLHRKARERGRERRDGMPAPRDGERETARETERDGESREERDFPEPSVL
eukprot:scaffold128341_cov32-Tisochrysis_lutea.AAC.2